MSTRDDQLEKYENDLAYRKLVDTMRIALAEKGLTYVDLLDAMIYATRLASVDTTSSEPAGEEASRTFLRFPSGSRVRATKDFTYAEDFVEIKAGWLGTVTLVTWGAPAGVMCMVIWDAHKDRGRSTAVDLLARATTLAEQPRFDPDFSPEHPINVAAAEARGLTYDRVKGLYLDEDGYPAVDKFGQKLG
jgi:hypothetical protein